MALPHSFLSNITAKFALQTFILLFDILFISKLYLTENMSDIRSLAKFSLGNIENYVKDNLHKVCSGAADDHMKNSMVN